MNQIMNTADGNYRITGWNSDGRVFLLALAPHGTRCSLVYEPAKNDWVIRHRFRPYWPTVYEAKTPRCYTDELCGATAGGGC